MTAPLFGFALSSVQILVVLVIGILLFGKRLPEVGRSLGKGLMEFKKGMAGIEDQFTGTMRDDRPAVAPQVLDTPRPPQRITESAPKFVENDPSTPPVV